MRAKQARRSLDTRLERLRPAAPAAAVPVGGWVRAVRDALGMSAAELAARMGTSAAAVSKLEASERRQTARLETLHRAAAAMECDLVYALVPRQSLEATVRSRAERVVERQFPAVANSMRLEGQGVSNAQAQDIFTDIVNDVVSQRGLWRD
jgi:predicted DNA-binding mobile mystery protein A